MPELNPDQILERIDRKPNRRMSSFKLIAPIAAAGLATVLALSMTQQQSQYLFSMSGQQKASSEVAGTSQDMMAGGDMKIANPFTYVYKPGADFAGAAYKAQVYKLDPIDLQAATQLITKLAKTFGVSGDVKIEKRSDQNSFDIISVGDDVETISMSIGATSSWYYVNQKSMAPMEPGQVAKKPSTDEVNKLINQVAKDLNLKSSDYQSDVYNLDWGTTAIITRVADGQLLPIETQLAWDFDGKLQNVGGFVGDLVEKGQFETITADQAIKRIDQNWWGSPAQYFYLNNELQSCAAVDTVGGGSVDSSEALPTPQVKEIEIQKAQPAMLGASDSDGNYWIVPGWNLITGDGCYGNFTIIALQDGVIKLPEVMAVY